MSVTGALSNLENVLQKNLITDRARECIFRAFGDTILKMYLLGTLHGGAFMVLMYALVCPKKLWIRHCNIIVIIIVIM